MSYDPADLAAFVREFAVRAHRALNDPRPDPARLQELAGQAAGLKGRLNLASPSDLERWLDAVRSEAETLAAAHSHAEGLRNGNPVAA